MKKSVRSPVQLLLTSYEVSYGGSQEVSFSCCATSVTLIFCLFRTLVRLRANMISLSLFFRSN